MWHGQSVAYDELLPWQIRLYGAIDEGSNFVLWTKVSPYTHTETIFEGYSEAVEKYGHPLRIRISDPANEHEMVRDDIECARPNVFSHTWPHPLCTIRWKVHTFFNIKLLKPCMLICMKASCYKNYHCIILWTYLLLQWDGENYADINLLLVLYGSPFEFLVGSGDTLCLLLQTLYFPNVWKWHSRYWKPLAPSLSACSFCASYLGGFGQTGGNVEFTSHSEDNPKRREHHPLACAYARVQAIWTGRIL